ncbi:unnamed protein product [Darwinula stevensoni]|uniref:Peptidase S1 domain-containing protein n=1 Tax=Darwinula stevensoni TaxID=69355 RepID=A0A7R9FRQ6_9CRUS|nr:unnamed protein product [Darwinula stevensoni]CAG0901926.1 unnamed protein product [Darwinula stevensoni]
MSTLQTAGYDIALIQLTSRLTFGPTIQPICYPTSDSLSGYKGISSCSQTAYGWGATDSAATQYPNILQKLGFTVVTNSSYCDSFTDGRIICAQGISPGSDACRD